jgi:hypothetical protein
MVSDNTFRVGQDSKRAIIVTGSPSGPAQLLKISGNTFISGEYAIGFLGNLRTVVTDNVTRSISLGVQTSTPYLQVINNHHFQ